MINWDRYVDKVKEIARTAKITSKPPKIGNMYSYMYDPKTKEKMQYYDILPLIVVAQYRDNGFIGINFHYLPRLDRLYMLNLLIPFYDEEKDITKVKMNYGLLNRLFETKWAFATKRYLFEHITSRVIHIPRNAWLDMIDIPVISFRKMSTNAQEMRFQTKTVQKHFRGEK